MDTNGDSVRLGRMVIHNGGYGSGFKNSTQADAFYAGTDSRLFQIKGSNEFNTRAVQVTMFFLLKGGIGGAMV